MNVNLFLEEQTRGIWTEVDLSALSAIRIGFSKQQFRGGMSKQEVTCEWTLKGKGSTLAPLRKSFLSQLWL